MLEYERVAILISQIYVEFCRRTHMAHQPQSPILRSVGCLVAWPEMVPMMVLKGYVWHVLSSSSLEIRPGA